MLSLNLNRAARFSLKKNPHLRCLKNSKPSVRQLSPLTVNTRRNISYNYDAIYNEVPKVPSSEALSTPIVDEVFSAPDVEAIPVANVEVLPPPTNVDILPPPVELGQLGLTEQAATTVVDPPFAELGLGLGWSPVSILESALESLYLTTGLPWWATISIGCVIFRSITFPFFLNSRKYMIRSANDGPENQRLMTVLADARASGNSSQVNEASRNLYQFGRDKKVSIFHLYPTIAMGGAFMCAFTAVRHITNLPLPSLEASSFLWLESLASNDPYRMLPLITGTVIGAGMHLSMKFGTPISNTSFARFSQYAPILPPILIPLLAGHLSGASQIFMLVNSSITTAMSLALMTPAGVKLFNMPHKITVVDKNSPMGSKDKSLKEWWAEQKETSKVKRMKTMDSKMRKQRIKTEHKRRAKELKGSPPVTYEIGTEAVLASSEPDYVTYNRETTRLKQGLPTHAYVGDQRKRTPVASIRHTLFEQGDEDQRVKN